MIAIAGLIFMLVTGIAKADEKKTITPQEFGNAIAETPGKIVNFISGEVEKTKEYQTKVWSEAKNKWPWNMFKSKNNESQD